MSSKYTKKPWYKLYKTQQWLKLRRYQLSIQPCCAYCDAQGAVVAATVVDHIKPHKGDEDLFFDPLNLQSLCKQHHDGTKQREDRNQTVIGGDRHGNPIDPNHHWNK